MEKKSKYLKIRITRTMEKEIEGLTEKHGLNMSGIGRALFRMAIDHKKTMEDSHGAQTP